MIVEYEITQEDLSAFSFYHHFRSPCAMRQYRRSWLLPPFLWLLGFVGIWYLVDRERGTPFRTFLALLPLFSFVPFYLLYFPWSYRRRVRKIIHGMMNEGHNRGLFTRHRVATSLDGIADATDVGHSSIAWRAVERVVRNDQYAFVYLNAFAAIIVPRRAFSTPEQFEEFIRVVNDHHERAESF